MQTLEMCDARDRGTSRWTPLETFPRRFVVVRRPIGVLIEICIRAVNQKHTFCGGYRFRIRE